MAYTEIDISKLDIGPIDTMEGCRGGASWQPLDRRPLRLAIVASDNTRIEADMPKSAPADAVALMEFVWLALTYGGDGEDHEHALVDLRAAMARQSARDTGQRVA